MAEWSTALQPDMLVMMVMFTPKFSIRTGCWNVRSLGNPTWQNGRLRDVLRMMKPEKSIEVLALSEVRWPGHGMSQLDDAVIAYSGMAVDDVHRRRRGVAVILGERAALAWWLAGSVFDPLSERIMRLCLKSHTGFVSLIVVYAPTNELKNEDEAVEFYQTLQACVRGVLEQSMLLIMGDLPEWEMMFRHGRAPLAVWSSRAE